MPWLGAALSSKPQAYEQARKTAPLLWPENLHLKARVIAVSPAGIMCKSAQRAGKDTLFTVTRTHLQVGATLVAARAANLIVPQLYKGAMDAISGYVSALLLPLHRGVCCRSAP